MQDLELLDEYLAELRKEKLRASHAVLVSCGSEGWADAARHAHEADLIERIRLAIRDLAKDHGGFIKKHMRRDT